MKTYVESNQSLKTQPGFIPNRDGPEIKFLFRSKTNPK
jgi:hypothetical protein